jgi:hypothetical protein
VKWAQTLFVRKCLDAILSYSPVGISVGINYSHTYFCDNDDYNANISHCVSLPGTHSRYGLFTITASRWYRSSRGILLSLCAILRTSNFPPQVVVWSGGFMGGLIGFYSGESWNKEGAMSCLGCVLVPIVLLTALTIVVVFLP